MAIVGPERLAAVLAAVCAGGTGRLDLVEAGLELDRVVDGQADQDWQDRYRGHRQGAADEVEEAEDEGG